MKRLNKLHFMIHGFCYACQNPEPALSRPDARVHPYLAREKKCAGSWRARLKELADDEALAIIPAGREGPAEDFHNEALSIIGDRCFMLDCADCLEQEFWTGGNIDFRAGLLDELAKAFSRQQFSWNKEELHTALHCSACSRSFKAMLTQRGYSYDPALVHAEGWGASFDGCVTKYTLNLRRMLGLSNVIGINFGMTVPDASFLLDAALADCVLLDNGLRLFILEVEKQVVGLYTFTSHSLADQPAFARLKLAAETTVVRSKQGIRLWPEPEPYSLPTAPMGCFEPPQIVVKYEDGCIHLPVSAGFVYRLAKAPAYVFMPREMPYTDARVILTSAELR